MNPTMNPDKNSSLTPAVGQAMSRKDGRLKVTGAARYSADWPEEKITYGVIFQSTIASGKVRSFDLKQAKQVPGVIDIITYENAETIRIFNPLLKHGVGDPQLPLQNNKVYYLGQPVGVVVAESLEAAEEAAALVIIHYKMDEAKLGFEARKEHDAEKMKKDSNGRTASASKGDIEDALKKSTTIIRQTYRLPIENHHPMETSSTTVVWDGDHLKVYDATQGVANNAGVLAAAFDVKKENMQTISKFIGGGFGCKGSLWSHVFIAVLAAKKVRRPLKIATTRMQMATNVGYRASTVQDVSLGSDASGKLKAIQHETVNPTAMNKVYPETTGALFKLLYQADAISTVQKTVSLNYPSPTFMRAPGECSGSFALESAMDELAHELKMDPIEIRLKNYAEKDPLKDIPFSSKSLKECYAEGAKKFGWDRRKAAPASVRDGDYYVGYGMATSSYPVHFFPATAKIELFDDGTAKVVSATQDIGTGTYTVMNQLAADALFMDSSKVNFDLGDSNYPKAGVSGGSSTVSSVGWAIADSGKKVLAELSALAIKDEKSPLHGLTPDAIQFSNGRIFAGSNPTKGETYVELMRRNQKTSIIGEGKMDDDLQKKHDKEYSSHSYGAQFAEVRVHALTGEVTLTRMVGAFAAGKIVNPKTARSQFMGGMIFGIGMGLTEHNEVDERTGKFMMRDLAEYHVPVNKDVPELDIIMVDEKDSIVNPAGTKGIGEIGTTGTAAAIANAVFNATGIRVRDMPITPDKLVGHLSEKA